MKDDVMSLLAAPAPAFSNRANTKPSLSGQYHLSSTTENFDLKIKELEEQAKQLKDKEISSAPLLNRHFNEHFDYGQYMVNKIGSNVNSASSSSNSTSERLNLVDVKNDENYFKKIKLVYLIF